MSNKLQKLGALFIFIAFILTWLNLGWLAIVSFVTVGLIDLFLVFKDKDTISQWIHRQFPKWGDMLVMVGLLVFTYIAFDQKQITPVSGFLPVLMGVIIGHLFWNSDR